MVILMSKSGVRFAVIKSEALKFNPNLNCVAGVVPLTAKTLALKALFIEVKTGTVSFVYFAK